MISKSPSLIGGVVGSPTNDTSNPKCNNLFENPLAQNPDLPAPATKILFAAMIESANVFTLSSSTCVAAS